MRERELLEQNLLAKTTTNYNGADGNQLEGGNLWNRQPNSNIY